MTKKREPIKRQYLPTLYLVATPIGNLGDLSSRAREVLGMVDAILCEDTRRTRTLLEALEIPFRRLERVDAHISEKQLMDLTQELVEGASFAMVTDAGTPGVSDPAAALVRLARSQEVTVVPVPGPSAVTALISVSGFEQSLFCFRGFFPRKRGLQEKEVRSCQQGAEPRVNVWFESPQRILEILGIFSELCPDAPGIVGKEISKIHERFFTGVAKDLVEKVKTEIEREGSRGEWCFAFEMRDKETRASDEPETSSWYKALECLLQCDVSVSQAVQKISQSFGIARNRVYEAALKKKREKQ